MLFVPAESLFSAALEGDHDLIVWAAGKRILLATPASLIALLRSVSVSWQQHAQTENARAIADAAQELYSRVATFTEHFRKNPRRPGNGEQGVQPGGRQLRIAHPPGGRKNPETRRCGGGQGTGRRAAAGYHVASAAGNLRHGFPIYTDCASEWSASTVLGGDDSRRPRRCSAFRTLPQLQSLDVLMETPNDSGVQRPIVHNRNHGKIIASKNVLILRRRPTRKWHPQNPITGTRRCNSAWG